MLPPIFGGWSAEPTAKAFISLHFSASQRFRTLDLAKGESPMLRLALGKIAGPSAGEDQRKCEIDKSRVTGSREPY